MNKVIGFHITAKNASPLEAFYREVFGWRAKKGDHHIYAGKDEIKGSIMPRGEYIPDFVSLIIEAEDIDAVVERCCANGGTVARPKFVPGNEASIEVAIIEDPEGHVITLMHRL
jgi:predicted enzyme related to lactoylglutathione lyase